MKRCASDSGEMVSGRQISFLSSIFDVAACYYPGSYRNRGFEKHQLSLSSRVRKRSLIFGQRLRVDSFNSVNTHGCKDACGAFEARLLLQPESCLSGESDLEDKKPSVRSWPV